MYYLVYISTAIKLLAEEELREILITNRKKNTERNLSGLLLYADGIFIQLLEGEQVEVELGYKNIELDRRHKNLIILANGEHEKRMFPDWSMGYTIADKEFVNKMTGYVNPLKPDLLNNDDQNPAMTLLKSFVESNSVCSY